MQQEEVVTLTGDHERRIGFLVWALLVIERFVTRPSTKIGEP